MTKRYEKWRELKTDPSIIQFKFGKLNKILSYLPAGNDVLECEFEINNELIELFLKIERSKVVDFETEVKNLNILKDKKYYEKIPTIIEDGYIENKKYIVLEKKEGNRLSEILETKITEAEKSEYLIKYGKELATIHKINQNDFSYAKLRVINEMPTTETSEIPVELLPYIKYLKENNFEKKPSSFIHGDFHYANILWKNKNIEAVLDFEYSGKGLKEQDIAWACILRPNQKFMNKLEDIKDFIKGYRLVNDFDFLKFKWCLINGYCHFYLMNQENEEYKLELINLLEEINKIDNI